MEQILVPVLGVVQYIWGPADQGCTPRSGSLYHGDQQGCPGHG